MSVLMDNKTPWHKEPMVWLLIALPLSAVIGGALTIWFAANNADPLVSEAYHKEGMTTLQVIDRDIKATELGVSAQLMSEKGQLSVQLDGRFATAPESLTLAVIHPTDAGADIYLSLMPTSAGTYLGPLPELASGKRRLVLTPGAGDWQLTGEWTAPFSGKLHLKAGKSNSSTHP